jgi:hypothetical protein
MRRTTWLATCLAALAIPAVALAAQGRAAVALAAQGRAAAALAAQGRTAGTGPQTRSASTGSGPEVTVRVEGLKKTLLLATQASGRHGWITKGGTPKGKCSGQSAAGALDVATHGHWQGSYSAQYQALSVIGIRGERHSFSSPYYWSIWVNNKYASSGACGIALKRGEHLLFAVEPDSQMWYPTALSAPHSATSGHAFTVKLVGYGSSGKKPLAGATITGNGITSAKTNHRGVATITASHSGRLVLRARPKDYVRTEAIVHVAA